MKKATLVTAALGIFAGLGGASHGPGEMIQGNVAPKSLVIEAWPSLTALSGEPAMTIIPSFLYAGILTIIVGVIVAVWAGRYAQRKHGGLLLILLSSALLLVGGGLIPPFFGIAGGIIMIIANYRTVKNGGGN